MKTRRLRLGWAVANGLVYVPHLVDLHHHLRGIRRDDQHIRVRLDQDPGFALVGLAQALTGFHGLGKAGVQIKGFANPAAILTDSAEVR